MHALLFASAALATAIAPFSAAARPAAQHAKRHIAQIENGLLPPVTVKGAAEIRLNLAEQMRRYRTPAVSVAVINNGEIEWARAWGVKEAGKPDPVTPTTLFAAGSISKPVAAMAALRLVEEGKLDLSGDVNRMLKSWKVPENEFTTHEKVTLRRLLNHSSGLPLANGDGRPPKGQLPTLPEVLSGAARGGLADNSPATVSFTPGARQQYSGAGYSVVQLLISDVAGKPFDDVMRDTVLGPLGMSRSTYQAWLPEALKSDAARGHNSVTGEPVAASLPASPALAAASLWTTPTDLARFIVGLQKARAGEAGHVLSKESADLMLTPSRGIWSLGLQVDTTGRTPRFWHDGSVPGFLSYMVAYNWAGQGAVVMVNQDAYNGLKIATEIMYGIAREYGWQDFGPLERAAIAPNPARYDDYVGLYDIDQGYPVTIARRADKLYLLWAWGGTYEMYPTSEGAFFIARDGAPSFTFLRNTSGRVTGVKRVWNGGEAIGSKSALPVPRPTGSATFRLEGHQDALVVSVIGDFNDWKRQNDVCGRNRGGWTCRVELEPGKHLYSFAVDNDRILDPANPVKSRDANGDIASWISIGS